MDDFLDKFNLIDRVQGFVWGLTSYLPHRRSHKGRKVGRSRIDGGTVAIHVDRAENSGASAERALERAHIPIAGRRITSKEAIFIVRRRQAKWAELVLLRQGIVLGPGHKMIDPKNVAYAANKGAVPLWGQGQGEEREEWASGKTSSEKSRQPLPTPTSGGNLPRSSKSSGFRSMLRKMW